MKTLFLSMAAFFMVAASSAQLKTTLKCPEIDIDILDGVINNTLTPGSTVGQIKLNLPCFTSFAEEDTTAECGGGVFYDDRDVKFYTTRNYIEIGPNFKGTMSLPLMGTERDKLFNYLGHPMIKDVKWDAFQTAYGIIILYYDAGSKVSKIQFSTESTKTIHLCEPVS